ncbi:MULTISPECIES: DUF1889 family protein [Yersinia]|uniref:DUF1889 family protein n=1 Tax=Yersinia TaxID=629 RepID=UPI0011A1BF01|nr:MULTISPECIES: DUF1889 family protein [Yersinia]HEN3245928.1 DUF1889 family protein [Yersinia enterocolitica]
MSAIFDKALKHLGAMNTSSSALHPYDESNAKELFKFLASEGIPLSAHEVTMYGNANGWSTGFTKKVAGWADTISSGGRVVVKHPGSLSDEYKDKLRALI